MRPIYTPNFFSGVSIQEFTDNPAYTWLDAVSARRECFMADEYAEYTYGSGTGKRTYTSVPNSQLVKTITAELNNDVLYGWRYNVCFLNYYASQKNALGWHADDSEGTNTCHPIAVVSFGASREIWWREKGASGNVPTSNKQLLEDGSLFVMPAFFQVCYEHKIPKADHVVGPRVSLTFRNFSQPNKL